MGGAASLLLALAMAPTGRSEDTASEVFSRETELMVGEGVEALPREPLYPEGGFAREGYELLTSQDAVLVETEKGFIQSWRLRVAWDGAAAGRLRMDVPAEDGAQTFDVDRVFEECVRPLATAVEHAARSIGGYGRAHVVLGINASQFSLSRRLYVRAIPGALGRPIQRWADGEPWLDDPLLGGMKRELLRACGIPEWEPAENAG